jgi:hypothetical protein
VISAIGSRTSDTEMEGARPIFSGSTSLSWNSSAPRRAASGQCALKHRKDFLPKVRELRQQAAVDQLAAELLRELLHSLGQCCVILHCSAARVKLSVDATARK